MTNGFLNFPEEIILDNAVILSTSSNFKYVGICVDAQAVFDCHLPCKKIYQQFNGSFMSRHKSLETLCSKILLMRFAAVVDAVCRRC